MASDRGITPSDSNAEFKKVLNSVVDNVKECKKNLLHFLEDKSIQANDNKKVANFISMSSDIRKKFHIPEADVSLFMNLLNDCYKEGVVTSFYEIQDVNKRKASGLFFHFEFNTLIANIPFEEVLPDFVNILFKKVLLTWITFPEDEFRYYCFYTKAPSSVYDHKTGLRKFTFRITFPGIMLDADTRYFIYERIWQDPKFKTLFQETLNFQFRDCFVRVMRKAPVTLFGSSADDISNPLEMVSIGYVIVKNGKTTGSLISLQGKESETFKNLVHEMSLNYPCNGSIQKKCYYLCSEKAILKAESDENEQNDFQRSYDDAVANYMTRILVDDTMKFTHGILSMLSRSRFQSIDSWKEVMQVLATGGTQFYDVAIMITKEKKVHLIKDDNNVKIVTWSYFNQVWDTFIHQTEDNTHPATTLRYWALCDSASQYNNYIDNVIKNMILDDIRHPIIAGKIQSSNVAKYIAVLFNSTFVTISDAKKNISWYEFVIKSINDSSLEFNGSKMKNGELYKWKLVNGTPVEIWSYITDGMLNIAKGVKRDLDALEDNVLKSDCDPILRKKQLKLVANLNKTFHSSVQNVVNVNFKTTVMKELGILLQNEKFVRQFDQTEELLGVGNGVVVFKGAEIQFIDSFHSYPITLYTKTNYVPYDKNNKYIQTIEKVLESFFPESEKDALEFMMYYLSTSLDAHKKESLFLIIHGCGCHAIDTPIRMYDGSIKMVQDVVIGDQIMGDDNTVRNVKELFRGTDDMVRICPINGDSFEVNKNHVLSLKFTNLASVCKCSDGVYQWNLKYTAVWHELDGVNQPKRKSKMYDSKADASDFLDKAKNEFPTMIKKGDVIDIKVMDLMKWDPWWLEKGNVTLYKSDGFKYPEKVIPRVTVDVLLDEFSIHEIGRGEYYGFELDGNHRYLTGDHYVHHNSNGKSVLMELFRRTLGTDYVRKMPLSFITDLNRSNAIAADPVAMELKSARLVYYSESDKNEKVNVAKIKELTGGETISARALYGAQENFEVKCNHIVMTNHRFVIETPEHAAWRRFLSYRMKHLFKYDSDPKNPFEKEKNPQLIEQINSDKRYQAAFLSILIQYRMKLYSLYGGQILKVPRPTIVKETEEYRRHEDVIQRFVMTYVYYYKGRNQSLDDVVDNFKFRYKEDTNTEYKCNREDLKANLRNSILQNYITQVSSGIYELKNLHTLGRGETPIPSAIRFSAWIDQCK